MSEIIAAELYVQVQHLNARYALGVDAGDAAAVRACFAEAGVLRVAGVDAETGATAIAQRLTSRSDPSVLHTSTGLVLSRSEAGSLAAVTLFFMFDTRVGRFIAAGRYDDVIEVAADGQVRWLVRDVTYQWRAS